MKNYPSIGIQIPTFLLPRPGVDLQKWAVIACDQFTSEPEYWRQVKDIVGDAPSTLELILPEVFLGTTEEPARIQSTQQKMREYLEKELLVPYEGLLLVERTTGNLTRRGLMLALDLEQYDYAKGSQSLIRATEGTILDRLPPRIRIRQGAPLELPHILVLIDDPDFSVIDPLFQKRDQGKKLYDFDLMLGSGHLRGDFLSDPLLERQVVAAIEKLAAPDRFRERYGINSDQGVLLFAMGDGNHSFATAKSIWNQIRESVPANHPARFAMVEIENVHDRGLVFEPIHRVLFGVKEDPIPALQRHFGDRMKYSFSPSFQDMTAEVESGSAKDQRIGMVSPKGCGVLTISKPESNLAVGNLQPFLDAWTQQGGAEKIDYVHGQEVVARLGSQPGHLGFYLPGMDKSDLFQTVILDGALPRKTFSMGEARDKRFYMECRKITL